MDESSSWTRIIRRCVTQCLRTKLRTTHSSRTLDTSCKTNVTHLLRTMTVVHLCTSPSCLAKGQLILKCPYEMIVSCKIPTKLFLDFCPKIFCSFLGASWKLFWDSCRLPYLWYYLLDPKEAQQASRKLTFNMGMIIFNHWVYGGC